MSKKKNRIVTSGQDAAWESNPFAALDEQALKLAENKPMPSPQAKEPAPLKKRGRVDVRREKSGRGGKLVTVMEGEGFLKTSPQELEDLLFQLKKQLACGGALKGKVLEIQGDKREEVIAILIVKGYQPIRVGG